MLRPALLLLIVPFLIAPTAQAQITETFKLTAGADAGTSDFFGFSVALSGDRALVGAPNHDVGASNTGAVYVFERQSDGTWNQVAKLTAADAAGGDEFGRSVALVGNRALVGAPNHDAGGTDAGAAYVFDRQSDGSWSQVAKITAGMNAGAGDFFGFSVALTGYRALVGAPNHDAGASNTGAVYVFERRSSGWNQVAKLTAGDAATQDQFGYAVALDGNVALVGAHRTDDDGTDSGSAYVFERQFGAGWVQVAKLTAIDAAARDYFGISVALAGDRALVGSYQDDHGGDTNAGSAYVFERESDGAWSQLAKLIAADADASDFFGRSVALSGDRALIGATADDDGGPNAGSAYVFGRDPDTGAWAQVAKLTATDAAAFDRFGLSVALSGTRALVGGDRNDDDGIDSGSAYAFDNIGFATALCNVPRIADKRVFATSAPPYLEIDLDASAGATLTSVNFVVDPAYFTDPSFDPATSDPANRTARFLEGLEASLLSGGLEKTNPGQDPFDDYQWAASVAPTRTATFKLESDNSDSFAYFVEITNSCGQTAYVDPQGAFEGFAVNTERGSELPNQVVLDGNYPNPFNPQTVIRYGLPEAAEVRLVVYDAMGREVRVLAAGAQAAGWHTATFEAGGLPSGVYLYRLDAGTDRQTGRMLLVK